MQDKMLVGEVSFTNSDGKEILSIYQLEYRDGNLAILMEDMNGLPYSMLSINVESAPLLCNEFVLDHNLTNTYHQALIQALLTSGLFINTNKTHNYGYCQRIPIWRLNR